MASLFLIVGFLIGFIIGVIATFFVASKFDE